MTSAAPSGAPPIVLTLWTDDPAGARAADAAGVDRVGPDLERLGKRERQTNPSFWLSPHREESLSDVRAQLGRARLFARTNPPHDGWAAEAERLIAAGVEVLMLPAFRSAREVLAGLEVVDGRARLVPLLETGEALADVEAIAACPGLREVHFGLNDLALSLGLTNRFSSLTHPGLAHAASVLREHGVQVGVGGIGRAGDSELPVPSDLIYAQYPRLGATGALIARSFFNGLDGSPGALRDSISAARARFDDWYGRDAAELEAARVELDRCVAANPESL